MQVILNRSIRNLGKVGDMVKVKDGYGRNYLLPNFFAVPANESNKKIFEERKADLLKEHEENLAKAKKLFKEVDGHWCAIIKNANYDGSLYGAISISDIYDVLVKDFADFDRKIIKLNTPIRKIGIYDLKLNVYDDIDLSIKINVSTSFMESEEAKRVYIENQMKIATEQRAEEARRKFDDSKKKEEKKEN